MTEKIDTSEWGSFVIGELFEKLTLKKNDSFNKRLDVSKERTAEFNLPLVNAKHGNNGIMYYGRHSDFDSAKMTIDIVRNGAVATGDVYAQPQSTGVLEDAYLLKPKTEPVTVFILLFLATVLEKTIKGKFSYDDKCTWEKVKKLNVSLPYDANGAPDWTFMNDYMESIVGDMEDSLAKLQLACRGKKLDGHAE